MSVAKTEAKRSFKDAIYEQLARIGKAISSPKRLELLDLLCQSERTVDALAKEANLTVANASQHLQILHAARLVEARKEGLFVIYRLADPMVGQFFRTMRILAENRIAEIEQILRRFLASREGLQGLEGLEPVDRKTLLERLKAGAVTVIDVRPVEEYRAGHIPGAISLPVKDLARRLSELPKNREVVAYCRGPYCMFALEAVEMLRAKGFKAVRLEDGIIDWQAMGLPVESERRKAKFKPIANSQ
jgi:rhodanese-related sulfurtransferase